MNIELTNLEAEMLKQYADVYMVERQEDATSDPIVIVEMPQILVASWDSYDRADYVIDSYNSDVVHSKLSDVLNFLRNETELHETEILRIGKYLDINKEVSVTDINGEPIEIKMVPIWEVWRPVAFFFTREEAKKYMKSQKHNLGGARIYTRNAGYSNNGDLVVLQKLLLRLGASFKNDL